MQENTTKELKTPMTTKQKVWFGVKIALNVVFYILILLVLLFSISNIRAKNKNDQIPNIFGKGYLNVLSDSMTGDNEDSFNTGDMIIVKIANKKNISKLEVGNIVTFYDYRLASNKGAGSALDTHRIVYIDKTNNDSYVYYTVGDKIAKQLNFDASKLNADNYLTILNSLGSNNYQAFGSTEIRGIYSGKWSGFGKTIQTINNHFIAIIIVPVAILLVFEIGVLVLNIMRAREEKLKLEMKETSQELANQETISADEKEKLKAELRAELLKEMLKESDNEEESKEKEENK
ncbi:MAG: hypothetical protein BHW10_06770 [Clostridium sp. CAG:307_30_263]|nr:MAG: hypothetical protein BHW10_06770 [Clostridium sp. CAG:307_30_263]